jgi:apolipoprotein N-acyltransferase
VPFELDWWGERPREPFGRTNNISPGGSSGVSPHQNVKTATLICYEDIFPQLAREYVQDDTDFLVNLTNDGWFGEGAAQWQQAAAAIFRAVENGVPLVRSTNNGLTCWVDANGRRREIFKDKTGSEYGVGAMTVEIPLRQPGEKRAPTFYNQHGDWFGWLCVGVTGILLVVKIAGQRREKQP